ncbi:hypothetical protein GNF82_12085 [Clostridium perfringens]
MDINSMASLVSDLGFPIVVAGGTLLYFLKTSSNRESQMWKTIEGFQNIMNKFDDTLKDVAVGLKDVKADVAAVKSDVADLKHRVEGEK